MEKKKDEDDSEDDHEAEEEQGEDCHRGEDDDEPSNADEDQDIVVALAACIEGITRQTGKRSSRLQQKANDELDSQIAWLMQEQKLDEACDLSDWKNFFNLLTRRPNKNEFFLLTRQPKPNFF